MASLPAELIRLINYVDDIQHHAAPPISASIPLMEADERKRLATNIRSASHQPELPSWDKLGKAGQLVAEVPDHRRNRRWSIGQPRALRSCGPGGYRTILEDLLPNATCAGRKRNRRSQLDASVDSGEVSAEAADLAFSRLEFAGTVEDAARPADLVIRSCDPKSLNRKSKSSPCSLRSAVPGTIFFFWRPIFLAS